MSKHTKTEWKQPINVDYLNEIHAKDESNPFNPNLTKLVAKVEKFTHVDPKSETAKALAEEWKANAKLIANAPKLLTALQNLVANIKLSEDVNLSDNVPVEDTEFTKALKAAEDLLNTLKD